MEQVNKSPQQEQSVAARPQRAEVIEEETANEKIAREKWEQEVIYTINFYSIIMIIFKK